MDRGLWRYTRHPNYFGDACVWWGIALVAAESGLGAIGLVGALVMTVLLRRVSGVPMLERTMAKRRPGYVEYVAAHEPLRPAPAAPPRLHLAGRASQRPHQAVGPAGAGRLGTARPPRPPPRPAPARCGPRARRRSPAHRRAPGTPPAPRRSRRRSPTAPRAGWRRLPGLRLERDGDVGRVEQGLRALGEQLVAAACRRVAPRPGHREHRAPVLERVPRGDARATALRRLDHDRDVAQRGDDPVAHREAGRVRPDAERLLARRAARARVRGRRACRAGADRRRRARSRRHRSPRRPRRARPRARRRRCRSRGRSPPRSRRGRAPRRARGRRRARAASRRGSRRRRPAGRSSTSGRSPSVKSTAGPVVDALVDRVAGTADVQRRASPRRASTGAIAGGDGRVDRAGPAPGQRRRACGRPGPSASSARRRAAPRRARRPGVGQWVRSAQQARRATCGGARPASRPRARRVSRVLTAPPRAATPPG